MGILDQLRHEATTKQQSEQDTAAIRQILENQYQTRILPKMQKVYTFLKEVVEHLSYLEKAIEIENYCQRFPQFGTLYQSNYKINTDGFGGLGNFDRIMQVNVTFTCGSEGEFKYEIEGNARIEQEVAFLQAKNVPFKWNQYLGNNGHDVATINITRKIPVRFRFEVDFENSKIRLLIHNHENFGVYNKTFEPEQINDAVLDEVLRFMLRKDSDFIQLDINSHDKERIRRKAEEEQMQRAQWLAELKIEELQAEEQTKKESSGLLSESVFFNRVKSLAKKKLL